MLEVYIEFLIAIFIYKASPPSNQDRNVSNTVIMIVLSVFVLFFVLSSIAFVSFSKAKDAIHDKWSVIHENISTKNFMTKMYRMMFCLRRIVFVYTVYEFKDNSLV